MTVGRPQDGMVTMDVYGRVVRVFRPGWRVWRWARWFLSSSGVTTHLSWILPIAGTRRWRSEGQMEVAAWLVPREHVNPRAAYTVSHAKQTRSSEGA